MYAIPTFATQVISTCILGLLLTIPHCVYAQDQSYTSYRSGPDTAITVQPEGGICLMGGRTEDDGAMRWFLERSEGGDILVLRTSDSDGYNDYLFSQLGVPVHSVETILCHSRDASYDPYVHQRIREADAIWFAGGDQSTYVNYWRDSPVDSLINRALTERNIPIGGTSAGMAIMGTPYFSAIEGTIQSDEALSNPFHEAMTVDSQPFLNLPILANTITDTHYSERQRQGRHVAFLARAFARKGYPMRGIACDEYTAVCIDPSGIAHVYGDYPDKEDVAYFLQVSCEGEEAGPENLEAGQPLTWSRQQQAVRVYKVPGNPDGTHTFDLTNWSTGKGGSWENWWVEDGKWQSGPGQAPQCMRTSLPPVTPANSPRVFPNPWSGVGQLYLEGLTGVPDDSRLIRPNGQRQEIHIFAGQQPLVLNIPSAIPGLHWLGFRQKNEWYSVPLYIQKVP
jgi:cyanophycinase-like exopeptidase